MKNKLYIKLFILSIFILIPISILYLNLGNNFFNNTKENLKNRNRNYINICNPTKANFYTHDNTPDPLYHNSNFANCKDKCNNNPDCNLYLNKDNTCNLYKLTDNNKIQVNCNSNIIPENPETNYTYLGEGKVDKEFYMENKDKFEHIDYLYNKADDIKTDYIEINNELHSLKGSAEKRNVLQEKYSDVKLKLNDLAEFLGLSRNSLYSNFVDSEYSMRGRENDKIKLNEQELSYVGMLKEFNKLYDESKDLEGRMNNDNLEYDRKYLVYTILSILMVISVIVFIIYKVSPDLIPNNMIISYFIGLLLLVFFIHNYFKI
tara:strand:- start:295 stop:1251 length:957 start_codon:yes stop_codon:yes gene_type:complete